MFKIYSEDLPFEVSNSGVVRNKITKRVYNQNLVKGYYRVCTTMRNKTRIGKMVHRMVAELFVPGMRTGFQVNHKDGDKLNNNADNLEWCTSQANRAHAFDTGLQAGVSGEANGRSKTTELDVRRVCELLQDGYRHKDAADEVGISRDVARDIKKGISWRSVSEEYDFSVLWELGFSSATAKWICHKLEDGMTPIEIQKICTSARVSIEKIKKIRDKEAYVNISKHFNF